MKNGMKRSLLALAMIMMIATVAFAAKPTIENVYFRGGHDEFPIVGKGTITLTDGTSIKGEFREGMQIKMFKWQWYDTKGKLHEIKEGDVQKVVFDWDPVWKKRALGPDIEINISLGNVGPKIEPKNLPYNIKQFKDFDQVKYWEPIILERIPGEKKLMLQVNNGFDSKLKVYVPLGAKQTEFGYGMGDGIMEIIMTLIKGGGDCGKTYKVHWVVKDDKTMKIRSKYNTISWWFGAFHKKEFEKLFGDSEEMMEIYPKHWAGKHRSAKYFPEYVWVYDHK
jgi:hypothetical protein